jgi:hypothetical protein
VACRGDQGANANTCNESGVSPKDPHKEPDCPKNELRAQVIVPERDAGERWPLGCTAKGKQQKWNTPEERYDTANRKYAFHRSITACDSRTG